MRLLRAQSYEFYHDFLCPLILSDSSAYEATVTVETASGLQWQVLATLAASALCAVQGQIPAESNANPAYRVILAFGISIDPCMRIRPAPAVPVEAT
jgi:hypothetical protein